MALSQDIAEPLWPAAKVAEVLGCSVEHVYRLHDDGFLPGVNVGRARRRATLRFIPADVAAFVGGRRATRGADATAAVRSAAPARVSVPSRVKTRIK